MRKIVVQHSTQFKKLKEHPRNPGAVRRSGEPGDGDALENAIAQLALKRARAGESLQILTGKLMEAQEEERKRIGRELHDGLTQQLAMFAVELGMLARQAPAEATVLMESIHNLRQRAECLSSDLRRITHQLHPATLEHLGLISALRSLCCEFTRHNGIRTWFNDEKEMGWIPPAIGICLYRISQEALRNVAKHSGAREAWVRISRSPDSIQLSIVDKGSGFNLSSVSAAGLGLVSMEERVRLVHGQIRIMSTPSEGTAIRINVPITWKEPRSAYEKPRSKTHAVAG